MLQLMYSFKGLTAPSAMLERVARGEISSFCLFAGQNVSSPEQLRELTRSLRETATQNGQLAPIIGIDQEGGQLIAIAQGATELPGNMALGATRSTTLAYQAGQVLGRELLAMGVNMNFAPSLDVNINPQNPVIGIRSFGDDPAWVADLGIAMIHGMRAEGVIATAKHFPGHGDVEADSHHAMSVLNHSLERLHEVELAPFIKAIAADVEAIMSAHILFKAVDQDYPATISSAVWQGLLRHQLGFNGLTITDAMDMHAVAQFGAVNSVRQAIQAGADLILLGHLPDQLMIRDQVQDVLQRDAVTRIQALQRRIPTEQPDLSVVGCAEHQAVAQAIADAAVTVVRANPDNLPLRLKPDARILVVTLTSVNLTPADTSASVKVSLADAIRRRHAQTEEITLNHAPSEADIRHLLDTVQTADLVIFGTVRAEAFPEQATAVQALLNRDIQPIVVALRTPFDIQAFPAIETYLCSYGVRDANMEAVARVLFGEILATGILPCEIPGVEPQYPHFF